VTEPLQRPAGREATESPDCTSDVQLSGPVNVASTDQARNPTNTEARSQCTDRPRRRRLERLRLANRPSHPTCRHAANRRINWPSKPTVATPDTYPAVAAAITRLIADAATALAGLKARKSWEALQVDRV
jgi:hypothetical protein